MFLFKAKFMLTKISSVKTNRLSVALLSSLLASVSAQLLFALPARAECWYEGMRFETGEKVGSSVCMPDGSWKAE